MYPQVTRDKNRKLKRYKNCSFGSLGMEYVDTERITNNRDINYLLFMVFVSTTCTNLVIRVFPGKYSLLLKCF